MVDQPATPQGQGDIMQVLLPLILQSVISGKPIDPKDLLPVLLQGLLGVSLALPAQAPVAPTPPQPDAPAAPQTANDALLQLLLKALAAKSTQPPEAKPEPLPPPAATIPAPGATPAPTDRGIAAGGFLGVVLSVLGQLTGVMPVVGETATAVGPTVAATSALALAGGALGAISPTLGIIARIAGAVIGAVRSK